MLRTVLTFEHADRVWQSDPRHFPGSKPIAHRKFALYLSGTVVPKDVSPSVIDQLDDAVPGTALIFRSSLWSLLRGDRLDPDLLQKGLQGGGLEKLGSAFRDLAEVERCVVATEIDCQLADFAIVEARIISTRHRLFAMEPPRILGAHSLLFEQLLRDKIDDWEKRLLAMRGIASALTQRLEPICAINSERDSDRTPERDASLTSIPIGPHRRSCLDWVNQDHSLCAALVLLLLCFQSDDPLQQISILLVALVNLACALDRSVFELRRQAFSS